MGFNYRAWAPPDIAYGMDCDWRDISSPLMGRVPEEVEKMRLSGLCRSTSITLLSRITFAVELVVIPNKLRLDCSECRTTVSVEPLVAASVPTLEGWSVITRCYSRRGTKDSYFPNFPNFLT